MRASNPTTYTPPSACFGYYRDIDNIEHTGTPTLTGRLVIQETAPFGRRFP